MQNLISFPGLGLEFTINRLAFALGGLRVYWYGIFIAVGFLAAMWYALQACKKNGIVQDHLLDMVLCVIPAGIIGARALYVIFKYNELYYYDFWGMFRIWDGGSAIFGGLVLGIITAYVYCKIRRIRFASMLDLAGPALLIAPKSASASSFCSSRAGESLSASSRPSGEAIASGTLSIAPIAWASLWLVRRGSSLPMPVGASATK